MAGVLTERYQPLKDFDENIKMISLQNKKIYDSYICMSSRLKDLHVTGLRKSVLKLFIRLQ